MAVTDGNDIENDIVKRSMKKQSNLTYKFYKVLALLGCLICFLSLPACGKEENSDGNADGQPAQSAEQVDDKEEKPTQGIEQFDEKEGNLSKSTEEQDNPDNQTVDTDANSNTYVPGHKEYQFVLTDGFTRDEVFRIEKSSCKKPEMMLYLITLQNQYEAIYGSEIWNVDVDGRSLEDNVKENALAKIAQIKTMNLMAASYGTRLTDEEKKLVKTAATEFYESLNDTEKTLMEVNYDVVLNAYMEYALAQKLYEYIIKDINPEVSDDEARTIKVQHILIKTYAMDGTGKKVPYTDNSKRKAKKKAEEAYALAKEGADFDELIRTYGDNENGLLSFGKGEVDPALEEVAFYLSKGEISKVIETGDGYEILKCISTFDKGETDANKVKIVEKKRKEVFGEQYNEFVASLTRHLNKKLWSELGFIHDEAVQTADFFDVIEKCCGELDIK